MKSELLTFNVMRDASCACGALIAIESFVNLPFEIKRVFYIYGVKNDLIRGEHAHKASNQLLVCVHGSCEITLDNGKSKSTYLLDRPDLGLLQPALHWGKMSRFSEDALLLVLSDSRYDPNEYIRNYDQFLALCKHPS